MGWDESDDLQRVDSLGSDRTLAIRCDEAMARALAYFRQTV